MSGASSVSARICVTRARVSHSARASSARPCRSASSRLGALPEEGTGQQDSPMNLRYDPAAITRWLDNYGDGKRSRLDGNWHNRVAFRVHAEVIARFVREGDRVLEA